MNRLSRLVLVFASVSLAVALGMFAVDRSSPSAVAPQPSAIVSEQIPMLPTIVVSARAEMQMMPTVEVRPSAAELLAASQTPDDGESLASSSAASDAIADLLPRARLDMPYYSFGKTLPRASKD